MKSGFNEWCIRLCMSVLITSITAEDEYVCPEVKTGNCSCKDDSELTPGAPRIFHIECGYPGIEVQIYRSPVDRIKIQCGEHTTSIAYEHLPVQKNSNISLIGFDNCALPAVSFRTTIHKMGISKVTELSLTFRKNDTLMSFHLKGLNRVMYLDLGGNSLSHLPDNIFDQMTALTHLNLGHNNLQLDERIFNTKSNILELDLRHNNIVTLTEGIFENMPSLENLYVMRNHMKEIKPGAFQFLNNLKLLDLGYNELRTLPPGIFNTLPNLQTLRIHYNSFTSLPDDLFVHNNKLRSVILYENQKPMNRLPDQFLANITYMKTVHFINIQLEEVSGNMFINSTALSDISLKDNLIGNIPPKLFMDQRNLLTLDLSYNEIEYLPNQLFNTTIMLKTLVLDHNFISHLNSTLLNPLTELRRLSINNNKISKIHAEAFIGLKNLIILDMSSNHMDLLIDSAVTNEDQDDKKISPFANLTQLEYLYLSNNDITKIYSDWKTSSNLKELDIRNNSLTAISYQDFVLRNNNRTVNLSFNKITKVISYKENDTQVNVKNSLILTVLLGYNPIICDCHIINFVIHLRKNIGRKDSKEILEYPKYEVDREANNIKCDNSPDFRGRLVSEVDPEELYCTNNQYCPDNCTCKHHDFRKAYVVNCSVVIDSSKIRMPSGMNHTELHMEGIQMKSFDNLNLNSPNNTVTRLYVRNNNLTVLPISRKVEVLDISNNQLQVVNGDIVEILKSSRINHLSLSRNPLVCECDNFEFLSYLQDNVEKITNYSSLNCSGTHPIHRPMERLCSTKLEEALPWIILALVVLVILIGIIINKYQHTIRVYLYNIHVVRMFHEREEKERGKIMDVTIFCSEEDQDFVCGELLPHMENTDSASRVCFPPRDWLGGDDNHTEIVRCIHQSKKIAIVLSPSFLNSEWGIVVFKESDRFAMKEGRAMLIIIVNCEIEALHNPDRIIQAYLTTNTYLQSEDKSFWNRFSKELENPPSFMQYFRAIFACLKWIFVWFCRKAWKAIMLSYQHCSITQRARRWSSEDYYQYHQHLVYPPATTNRN